MDNPEANKSLSIRQNSNLTKVNSNLELTNKLLFEETMTLFNEAFRILIGSDANELSDNFFDCLKADNRYIEKKNISFFCRRKDEYEEAQQILSNIPEKHHKLKIVQFLFGISLFNKGRKNLRGELSYVFAIENFEDLIDKNPDFNIAITFYCAASINLITSPFANASSKTKEFSKKYGSLNSTKNPDKTELKIEQLRNNKTNLFENLAVAINDMPEYHLNYYYLGLAEKSFNKNYEKAIKLFDKVISLKNNFFYAQIEKAYCYRQLKNFTDAIVTYSFLIELDEIDYNKEILLENRAKTFSEMKKNFSSILDYNQLIISDPWDEEGFHLKRGLLFSEKKCYQRAISDLKRYLKSKKINFLDADVLYLLSQSYQAVFEFNEAYSTILKAEKLNPLESKFSDLRAEIERELELFIAHKTTQIQHKDFDLEEFKIDIEIRVNIAQSAINNHKTIYAEEFTKLKNAALSDRNEIIDEIEFIAEEITNFENEMFDYQEALNRISTKTFGICRLTGDLIPKNQLKKNPLALIKS